MDIVELLQLRNIDAKCEKKNIKMFRHVIDSKEIKTEGVYRTKYTNDCNLNCLEIFQSYQEKRVLDKCEYLVSFIGTDNKNAKLIGVYEVGDCEPAGEVPYPKDYSYASLLEKAKYHYALTKCSGFDDLVDRVVINWEKSRAWHQWLSKKEIVEMYPMGYVADFPGFMNLSLCYDELVSIINNREANREWHTMLSSVAGVYLILDTKEGKQYIGSAYGAKGILGRWEQYTAIWHGKNKRLKEIYEKDSSYARNFKYCILHTMSKSSTKEEVIRYEGLFKEKLGSRAFGLNAN